MDFKGPPCQAQEGVLGGFIGSRRDVRAGYPTVCVHGTVWALSLSPLCSFQHCPLSRRGGLSP